MKQVLAVTFFLAVGFSAITYASTDPARSADERTILNIIEGTVFDPNHRPVPDVWVELQNEFNMTYKRVRTSTSGRFSFSGIGTGRYTIKVYATGTPFEDQSETVEIINVVQNSSDAVYQDVVLHYSRQKSSAGTTTPPASVVFVQDVPAEAQRLYKQGAGDLNGGNIAKGVQEIDAALKIFPDYYEALNTMGAKYVDMKEYQKSFPYLIHAIDVNSRSFPSYFNLAYAAFELNRLPEAKEAARAAAILQPNNVISLLLYGTLLRMTGELERALPILLKAEKLSRDAPVAKVHYQLALLYNKLNRNAEAADQLDAYLKAEPNAPDRKEIQTLIQKLRTKTT